MGLYYRRKLPIHADRDDEWVNLSKHGASVSKRVGKRVTVNSRGRVYVRLARGLSWRGKLF